MWIGSNCSANLSVLYISFLVLRLHDRTKRAGLAIAVQSIARSISMHAAGRRPRHAYRVRQAIRICAFDQVRLAAAARIWVRPMRFIREELTIGLVYFWIRTCNRESRNRVGETRRRMRNNEQLEKRATTTTRPRQADDPGTSHRSRWKRKQTEPSLSLAQNRLETRLPHFREGWYPSRSMC